MLPKIAISLTSRPQAISKMIDALSGHREGKVGELALLYSYLTKLIVVTAYNYSA